ncbi:SRPBCC family protein [Actinophytocola sp.]|uniref:SRPBCC family protein n=1 Tax=Actinophytocola sp. TaxID=1872138 RepID=UPI002D7E1E4D|nr:SRPBCC family protein [Actinophytocola sp.]HET9142792.1 SRPBCC family protein [Actinophytocola sp.]
MIDFVNQINAIRREVGTGQLAGAQARSVLLRRRYEATVEDVWDACTSAERISRWFMPVTGDLRLGGRYQLQGNAGGEILRCDAPSLLRLTWVMGEGPPSEVEVRLSAAGEATEFELEHIAIVDPGMWDQFGPGAVGVGWDLGLLGLALHLAGGAIDNPEEWQTTAEAKDLMARSSQAWGAAYRAAGADPEQVASAVKQTTAFYTGDPA